MSPLYFVIKIQIEKGNKPNYEVDDIVRHGRSNSLPSHTADTFTICSYHTARNITHVTFNITETYDIRVRWHYDPNSSASVVAYSNDKASASILMNEEVDKLMEREDVDSQISTRYDAEGGLVFMFGLKTARGDIICFELFVVEID